jgi:membrane protein DedA with SNARE-associated domain
MDVWSQVAEFLLRLIDRYDEVAVVLLVTLDEAGIPSPLPGDLIILLAGYRIQQGQMNLILTLLLLEAASIVGGSLQYWLGARGGRLMLLRYGRLLRITPARLDRVEEWVTLHGIVAILIGRLVPVIRGFSCLAAGAFGMPYRTFLPALAIGALIYNATLLALGMWLGPRAVAALAGLHLPIRAVLTILLFVGVTALLVELARRAARQHQEPEDMVRAPGRLERAVLAGVLATVEMALGVNLLLYLISGVVHPFGATLEFTLAVAERGLGEIGAWRVALAIVFVLGTNVVWAVLYAQVLVRYLPGSVWARGLLFSMLPLGLSVLVLLPLLGAGPLGLGLGGGLLPLAGEAFRNVLFGSALAVSHALLRPGPTRPVPPDEAEANVLPT